MMDPYDMLLEQRRRAAWSEWPENMRAVLPAMARQRSAKQQSVWYPSIVYIEPTNACNATCVFCPRSRMKRARGYMSMDLYRKIVEETAQLGPSELRLFHYGEPMLHPRLADMIRIARQHHLTARFQTNGLLIREKQIHDLLDAGLNYIGVSVNGLVADDYEKIRPGRIFAELSANLFRLRSIIDGSGKRCHIHLNAHVGKNEVSERDADVQAYKKQWLEVADSLSISGLSEYQGVNTFRRGVVEQAVLQNRKPDENVCCAEPFDRMVIKWNGDVSPCCADYDGQMIVGNVSRETVEDVWSGKAFDHIRSLVQQRKYSDLSLCRTCPKFYSETYNLLFVRTKYRDEQMPQRELELI